MRTLKQQIERVINFLNKIFYSNHFIQAFIIKQFHILYYYFSRRTWLNNTNWLNFPVLKCPLDLWIYQEIIYTVRPDVIIETGTFRGGSALFLASICDLINNGRVISIDIVVEQDRPQHKRITYLVGSSTSEKIIDEVKSLIAKEEKILVILDSSHHKDHVLNELKTYHNLVSIGSYIIVEDTNMHGHPIEPNFPCGPMEAVKEFLRWNKDFIVDKNQEKFYLTFNPNGYLKKIK